MLSSTPSFARSHRLSGVGVGAALVLMMGLASSTAQAGERQLRWSLSPEPMPTLRLQPEQARLMLTLPPEWMPAQDLGQLGVQLDPRKNWRFRGEDQLTTNASIGTSFRLSVEAPSRGIRFGFSLMPRKAVAVLQFDPLPAHLR